MSAPPIPSRTGVTAENVEYKIARLELHKLKDPKCYQIKKKTGGYKYLGKYNKFEKDIHAFGTTPEYYLTFEEDTFLYGSKTNNDRNYILYNRYIVVGSEDSHYIGDIEEVRCSTKRPTIVVAEPLSQPNAVQLAGRRSRCRKSKKARKSRKGTKKGKTGQSRRRV